MPRSALGRALQDADRLEALGAIGLYRTIGTGQRMGGRYFDPLDPWAEARPLDDRRYSVDHFFRKLLLLPDTMQTAAGREEARHCARLLEVFLDALAHELDRRRPARLNATRAARVGPGGAFEDARHRGGRPMKSQATAPPHIVLDLLVGVGRGVVTKLLLHLLHGAPLASLWRPGVAVLDHGDRVGSLRGRGSSAVRPPSRFR